ncbi:MAG: hypothetical protein ACTHJM_08705 [Marmoricola sp.]
MLLSGDFVEGFVMATFGSLIIGELLRRWRVTRRGPEVEAPMEFDGPDDVVARLATSGRSMERASRLLDEYEVAVQDRVHLHFRAKQAESSGRQSELDGPREQMRIRVAALRLLITRGLLDTDRDTAA